ncbi:MAG: hypothetical protein LBC79_06020 [Deltaproteobacteria bacterium]|nr:hypothetical protein [Deltaproteobacteria bacterium]
MMRRHTLSLMCCFLGLAMLAGCVGGKRADNFQTMTLDYQLIGGLSSPNPEIRLTNVPPGTAFLKVAMRDTHRPNFDHGGGVIAYDGSGRVPEGSLSRYRGPQPPAGETHRYVITVQALNADQSMVLGEGRLAQDYP